MAFGKLSDDGDDQPLSEINMIPMIDVMLVLRIDKRVEYGIIARVMAQASQHGLHKIAFVSQPDGK
ncbi:hypothetical protein LMCDFJHI_00271 [Aeromonas salmonicida]|uniref:ExbD/TolR family protein n=1 Tax=Aeromonas salmonicida TaxID=645 RepID=UPI00367133B2